MAERRMFAKTIIDSDAFLDMPLSTQALYFHLNMRADDEGFVNNPKKIARMIGTADDDLKMLFAKNFIISFESGVIVIKHWRIHNYIRADRLVATKYEEERKLLEVKGNGAYTISECIKEIENLDSTDLRKIAYKNSSLPYSFNYKIKRAFDGEKCPNCGKTMMSCYKTSMPTIQHNMPISKGGKHEIDNISVICESCNTSIRDKETEPFNNSEVIDMWDRIIYAEKNKINWFNDTSVLKNIYDGHLTDICQSVVSTGKNSIGKDSIEKDSIDKYIVEIVDYLNLVCHTNYSCKTKNTIKHINARLSEGFTVDDFKMVIDKKANEWLGTSMEQYLRPDTLFGTKFESYLNQNIVKAPTKVSANAPIDWSQV